VDTLTRPPQTPVTPRSIIEARRRWPKRLAVILACLASIAGIWAVVWAANVEPIVRGGHGFAIDDPALHATESTVDAFGTSGYVATIPARPGLRFTYLFSIRNDGPVPVTIGDVGFHGSVGSVSTGVVAAEPDIDAKGRASGGFTPFVPFRLDPGREAAIRMEVRLADDVCIDPHGGTVVWYSEPVTYEIYGMTRHGEIDTGHEIRLTGTPSTAC
jgi:hypothetical protein